MRAKTHRVSFTLVLIAALVALLALLAVFQYRWLGQISVAERQTMQANLRSQGRALQEEIAKHLECVASSLLMSVSEFRNRAWDDLIDRYSSMRASGRFPGLVKNVFLANTNKDGQLEL